jgi:N-acetyl-gamma-glutamylphosphate reductase
MRVICRKIRYLTAVGLTPGGSNTVHIYTQTIHRTTQSTQTIHRTTQQLGRVRAVPRLCGFYPGICLTTEEKARKNLSQGSRRMPVGKGYTEQSIVSIKIHKHNDNVT